MVNIGNMMKQAQQLQQKMADAQEKLNSIEVEGESGGGVVKVTATAKGEIKRINLDQSLEGSDSVLEQEWGPWKRRRRARSGVGRGEPGSRVRLTSPRGSHQKAAWTSGTGGCLVPGGLAQQSEHKASYRP